MAFKKCIEWVEESYEECAEWRDDGYNTCSEYEKSCSDWLPWPLSYICDVFEWVCIAWYWVSNWVCAAWVTITTSVCVLWEAIAILVAPIAILLELILSIPVIGRLIGEIISIGGEIIWRVVGLVDASLDLIGVVFPKKLRVCVVILKDEKGNPVSSEAVLKPFIDDAIKIYDDEARINLMIEGIHTVDNPSPSYALDVDCGVSAWGADLWLPGSYFESLLKKCLLGGLGRITGYGAPVTVFAVRKVPGDTDGCSLGPLTDYVTIEGGNPVCFAHEIVHALGLWHVDDANNLAHGICGGKELEKWQRIIIRNSRHVTYV